MLEEDRFFASKYDLAVSQYLLRIKCIDIKNKLRRIVGEMTKGVNEAQQFERDIFSAYIAKCNSLYCGYVLSVYTSLIFFMIGPLVLPIPYTTNVEYPFQVNHMPINIVIYFYTYVFSATHLLDLYACTSLLRS
jgi:hypothetical protein